MLKGSARLTDCKTPWQRRKHFSTVAAKQALLIAGSAARHHLVYTQPVTTDSVSC